MAAVLADLSLRISTNTALLQQGLDQVKAKLSTFKNQATNLGSSLKGIFSSAAGEISGSMNAMTGGMSGMLSAGLKTFKGLTTGIQGFSTAFIATGIGAIIMVVVAALAGLVAAFKRSGTAADAMEQGLAFIKGILNLLIGVLVKVGEWLVKAFKSDAVSWLGEAILNIVNRVQGLIQIFVNGWKAVIDGAIGVGLAIKGIFNEEARKESQLYFAKMIEDLGKVGEGFNSMVSGKPTEAMQKFTDVIKAAGNAGMDIEKAKQANNEKEIKAIAVIGAARRKLGDLIEEIAGTDKSTTEGKVKAEKLTTEAVKQQAIINTQSLAIKQRALDIAKAELFQKSGSNATDEDRLTIAKQQGELDDERYDGQKKISALLRKDSAYDAKVAADREKATKAEQTVLTETAKLNNENTVLEIADAEKASQKKMELDLQEALFKAELDKKDALKGAMTVEEKKKIEANYLAFESALYTNYYDKIAVLATDSKKKELEDVKSDTTKSFAERFKALEEEHKLELMSDVDYQKQKRDLEKTQSSELLSVALSNDKLTYAERLKALQDYHVSAGMDEIKFAEAKRKLDEEEKKRKSANITEGLQMASQFIGVLSTMQEAAKNKELAAAGDDEKRKEAIMKKYGQKAKSLAIAQALINGALAVTNLIASIPGSVINPATWVGIGIAAAATAAQIALISSTPLAKGGLAYGKTLATVGEYPGARSNPEVVAPLDKLKNLIKANNMSTGPVEFVLRGADLYGSQDYYRKLRTA